MILKTKRLYLVPYQEEHLADAFGILGNSETMSFYPNPFTLEQVKSMIRKNMETYEKCGYGLHALIEKENGALIGDCGITVQDIDGQDEFEIGYRICRTKWGRGYGPEAAEAMKEYGFKTLGLKKLCSYMPADHFQSRCVAEKLGMKLEKEYNNPNNRNFPTVVYSVFSSLS